ncbi:MAG: hypothetical protein K8I04_15635 [Gammaproteobacteria bacterium]|nr:hypothetical protein [Gammaproteobacteria bacterium]
MGILLIGCLCEPPKKNWNRQDAKTAKENLFQPPRRQDAKKIFIHEKSWRLGALAVR